MKSIEIIKLINIIGNVGIFSMGIISIMIYLPVGLAIIIFLIMHLFSHNIIFELREEVKE